MLLSSCHAPNLWVRTETIDQRYLASYRLQTPCVATCFCYQQLVIHYRVSSLPATLQVKLRFANHEVKMQEFPLKNCSGYTIVRIDPKEMGEITGYLIELFQGEVKIETYSHLWVEPIPAFDG